MFIEKNINSIKIISYNKEDIKNFNRLIVTRLKLYNPFSIAIGYNFNVVTKTADINIYSREKYISSKDLQLLILSILN